MFEQDQQEVGNIGQDYQIQNRTMVFLTEVHEQKNSEYHYSWYLDQQINDSYEFVSEESQPISSYSI